MDLDRAPLLAGLQELLAAGKSIRAAAKEVGLDKQTARRWLRGVAQNPLPHIERESEPPARRTTKVTRRSSR
jgi:transposase